MANNNLFNSGRKLNLPKADTVNNAGGTAYSRTAKEQLAQYAATGCFNDTFYANANDQLNSVLEISSSVEPDFLAKVAVYSRKEMRMKDMPALLVAALSVHNIELFNQVFPLVIDDVKMLRNFVQIVRSGVVGRNSLGTSPKNAVRNFLNNISAVNLYRSSVGKNPTLGDIIKLAHPKPETPSKSAVFNYLMGKDLNPSEYELMPDVHHQLRAFRDGTDLNVPNVPFEMLTSTNLTPSHWKEIAMNMTWNQTRMNLNTLNRHGVLSDDKVVKVIAERLRDPELVKKNNAFPYQLMTAFINTHGNIPTPINLALQDALELATFNVPNFGDKNVTVIVDVSGSMSAPVTGYRKGSTSKVSCVHVAGLFASCILRKNQNAKIASFDHASRFVNLNPRDSVMTNAKKIFERFGGGTDMSKAFSLLKENKTKSDLTIIISDNESWMDGLARGGFICWESSSMELWTRYNRSVNNGSGKLVCLDITPNSSTQLTNKEDKNILNIGGFSDQVFTIINKWFESDDKDDFWVDLINNSTYI